MQNRQAWVLFWLLTLIWGSSFLLMRVGVEEIPPAQLTFVRLGIAAIGTNIMMWLGGKQYPRDWKTLRALTIIGVGNSAVPFTLLAWGELTVASGLTSVIQAITPVFTMIIAHFAFDDERITTPKIAGIILSFSGIALLSSGGTFSGSWGGFLAILIASLCYAIFTTYSRKVLRGKVEPLAVSTVTMSSGAVVAFVMMYAAPLVGEALPVSFAGLSRDVLLSALALGFFNTFLAYLMFYRVVAALGASRTSMVTYVVPVVAVTLGAVFLQEIIDARLIVGGALIIGGISIVNLRFFSRVPKPA